MCDETLPFLSMASELSDRGISHSGVQCEIDATTLVLRLLMMPQPPSLDSPPDACVFNFICFIFMNIGVICVFLLC